MMLVLVCFSADVRYLGVVYKVGFCFVFGACWSTLHACGFFSLTFAC